MSLGTLPRSLVAIFATVGGMKQLLALASCFVLAYLIVTIGRRVLFHFVNFVIRTIIFVDKVRESYKK